MAAVDPASKLDPKPPNVEFIDLTDRFCDDTLCLPVSGNVLIYRDTHHLTREFSRTLAPALGERMRKVRPDLFSLDANPNMRLRAVDVDRPSAFVEGAAR